jgi:hypothetical protein
MRHIVLISCVKRKGKNRAKSQYLYESALFRKSLSYARSLSPDAIYVLSAKYGLVDLDREIDPYDETLKNMPMHEVKAWGEGVLRQLRAVADLKEDRFTFLVAERYRRFLLPHLSHAEVPMRGLGIGQQLQYLTERTI